MSVSFAENKTVKAQGVLEYKVAQANYSTEHVRNATQASLVLNYDKGEVALNVQVAFYCPEDRVCAQVTPRPLSVVLPIVSVKTDICGIRTVTAQIDRRPADGELQQIRVSDPSHMTCKTFVAVIPEAIYTTSYSDRRNTLVYQSKMTLTLKSVRALSNENEMEVLETSMAPAIVIKYVIGSGFSPNPTLQNLYIDKIGRVINSVKVLKTNLVTTTQVAQLSPEALKNLNEKIVSIPVTAKLVDANEGEPRCMDAPTSTISVVVQNHDVPVFQRSGCHNLTTEEGSSSELRELMMAFLGLTY